MPHGTLRQRLLPRRRHARTRNKGAPQRGPFRDNGMTATNKPRRPLPRGRRRGATAICTFGAPFFKRSTSRTDRPVAKLQKFPYSGNFSLSNFMPRIYFMVSSAFRSSRFLTCYFAFSTNISIFAVHIDKHGKCCLFSTCERRKSSISFHQYANIQQYKSHICFNKQQSRHKIKNLSG